MARTFGAAIKDALGLPGTGNAQGQPPPAQPGPVQTSGTPDIYDQWAAGLKQKTQAEAEAERREQERQAAERHERCHWPKNKKLPTHHVKRQVLPCPECRRVLMDNGAQAVICAGTRSTIAFFRCKCCDHRWQMPVKTVE